MIKLIISLFLIFIFSCKPISNNIVIAKIEQTKENLEDGIKNKSKTIIEDEKKLIQLK